MSTRAGGKVDSLAPAASPDETEADGSCYKCEKELLSTKNNCIRCGECKNWYHIRCVGISISKFRHYSRSTDVWTCSHCCTTEQANTEQPDIDDCPLCKQIVTDDHLALQCGRCEDWCHTSCLYIQEDEYNQLYHSTDDWFYAPLSWQIISSGGVTPEKKASQSSYLKPTIK